MTAELKILQIETTNYCNSNCVFCIHSTLKKFGMMSDELFLKILNDAKEIPSIEFIVPMMLGEPFTDPKIIDRLKLINKILPNKKIVLFSNCSLITPQKIKDLIKIKNMSICFSLNGTKEVRKRLMGLDDYEHAIKMVRLYASLGGRCSVQMIKHPSVSTEEIKAFINEFPTKPPLLSVINYKNWSGDKFCALPKTGCERAISNMTIMYNGLVNLCCMEYGKVIFGDVNKSSVKEVWESPERQRYCKAHLNKEYLKGTPCSNCTTA